MPIELLSTPWGGLYWIAAVAASLSVHEFAHALTASWLGDATPKNDGRVTLFPFPHLDPLGFLLFLFFGIGWAKPVRFDPSSLRYRNFGKTVVALAGPLSNLLFLAVAVTLAKAAASVGLQSPEVLAFLTALITVNAILIVVNVIPIPPFDGSKLLLDALEGLGAEQAVRFVTKYGPVIAIALLFLDGSSLGAHVVPRLLTFVITLAKSYIS